MRRIIKSNRRLYDAHLRIKGICPSPPTKYDDLFVSGFPRSGNTFFSFFMRSYFPEKRISTHYHVFAGVRYALSNQVPALIIIRDPVDAISSLLVKDSKTSAAAMNGAIHDYIDYYSRVHQTPLSEKLRIIKFEHAVSPEVNNVLALSNWLGWVRPNSDISPILRHVTARIDELVSAYPDTAKSFTNEKKRAAKKEVKSLLSGAAAIREANEIYEKILARIEKDGHSQFDRE